MKIAIAWESKNKKGGGWSFVGAFEDGVIKAGHSITSWQDADIVLIPSASVISKEFFRQMKAAGKTIVLRVDNALKNSRNSGNGMARLKEFAEGSSQVVFQGKWCREYIGPFIERDGVIIHNGVDTTVFRPDHNSSNIQRNNVYLYSCASKGETKRWEWAWYRYQMIQRENPTAELLITGDFPDELRNNNFDFFMGERHTYLGMIIDPVHMAQIYNQCKYLMATYENDAFSQTYIEALCCGCELTEVSMTGGTPEILELYKEFGPAYFSKETMVDKYIQLFKELI